jgi:hypothetical protein
MGALIDFFAVRPVFTLYGLRVLWGAYLISQALPIVAVLNRTGLSSATLVPILIIILQAALNVAIFRLLIEVAAATSGATTLTLRQLRNPAYGRFSTDLTGG